ncbi:MAG TPA: hypothetical protein VEJ67_14145 [Candidatus Cybelea sp.]|nr:hypothetical protein [Candidatus Cybelea sp.]
MACKDGRLQAAFASHFWPGGAITTIRRPKPNDTLQVTVIPVPDFVAQSSEGACSQPIFEERITAAETKVHNGLAQVWAHNAARFGRAPRVQEWTGIDAFTLLKHENRWRIVSLVFAPGSSGPSND